MIPIASRIPGLSGSEPMPARMAHLTLFQSTLLEKYFPGIVPATCEYCGRSWERNKGCKTCDGCGAAYTAPIGRVAGVPVSHRSSPQAIVDLSNRCPFPMAPRKICDR